MNQDTMKRAVLFVVLTALAFGGLRAWNYSKTEQVYIEELLREVQGLDDPFVELDEETVGNEDAVWNRILDAEITSGESFRTTDVRGTTIQTYEAEIVNPNTFHVQKVWYAIPDGYSSLPMVVLLSGGIGDGSGFTVAPKDDVNEMEWLAAEGFVVVAFQTLGVGESEGEQDFYGFADQDGIAAIVQAAKKFTVVNPYNIGLASFSYGVTGAAGVVARYPELGIKFLSDWEGPSSRFFTTIGCKLGRVMGEDREEVSPADHDCADDTYWAEREAAEFMKGVDGLGYYWRIQQEKDHIQPTYGHTVEMLESVRNSFVTWFRVNAGDWNTVYNEETVPVVENGNHFVNYVIPHLVEMSQFE